MKQHDADDADRLASAFAALRQTFDFDDGMAVIDHRVGGYRLLAREPSVDASHSRAPEEVTEDV